jgi:hypothetical protein
VLGVVGAFMGRTGWGKKADGYLEGIVSDVFSSGQVSMVVWA